MAGVAVDAGAVTDDAAAATSGVAHAATLLAFADALVDADDAALARARDAVRAALGDAALVDTAAVASNFERMVRVADGTGIPLDPPVLVMSADLRQRLGIDRFPAAGNTPAPRTIAALAGHWLRPVAFAALRALGWWRRR